MSSACCTLGRSGIISLYVLYLRMIFSKKNAGKWVASKDGKVIATSKKLPVLMKKVETRKDREAIGFDLVPPQQFFAGFCAVPIH
jgi:hypothetical protein